jgi:hypothetical protein
MLSISQHFLSFTPNKNVLSVAGQRLPETIAEGENFGLRKSTPVKDTEDTPNKSTAAC